MSNGFSRRSEKENETFYYHSANEIARFVSTAFAPQFRLVNAFDGIRAANGESTPLQRRIESSSGSLAAII